MTKLDITITDHDLTATVDAHLVEDSDDCLAATIALVAAADIGFAADYATADWADDDRESIEVSGWTSSSDSVPR